VSRADAVKRPVNRLTVTEANWSTRAQCGRAHPGCPPEHRQLARADS